MATNTQTAKQAPLSPESVREQLLNPLPHLSLRFVMIMIVILLVLGWSWNAAKPTAINRISGPLDPFVHFADLIGRMYPPEFELQSGTETTINVLGHPIVLGWPIIIDSIVITLQMAVIGTLAGIIMSLPLALLAARNTSPSPAIYQTVRVLLNLLRSVPELVYALLFVAAVGLGPFTGVMALAFSIVGSLSRVYAEAIEQIDAQQVLALRATGANGMQTFVYAVIPQALPLLISYSIVYFEHNVRNATIVGYVGAGGVGLNLFEYMGFSNYPLVAGTVIVLVVVVTVIDRFSSYLRQRFI